MKKETKKPQQFISTSAQTPPIMVDHFEVFQREDNLCFIRMSTSLPEGVIEQGKFFMTKEFLKNFIESATKALDSSIDIDTQEKSIN